MLPLYVTHTIRPSGEQGFQLRDPHRDDSIKLTYVPWPEGRVNPPSFGTHLSSTSVEATRIQVQHSKHSPLGIYPEDGKLTSLDDTFSLPILHVRRLKSLSAYADVLPDVLRHFFYRAPLLEDLYIDITSRFNVAINEPLFNRNLSPYDDLTKFNCQRRHVGILLFHIFESISFRNAVGPEDSIQRSSSTLPGQMVPSAI
jgi:hypothetical protein